MVSSGEAKRNVQQSSVGFVLHTKNVMRQDAFANSAMFHCIKVL
jgi:hypothetical protein